LEDAFLIFDKHSPVKNVRFYQVWLDKFLSYYQKNLKAVQYNNIKEFLDKLESEGKEKLARLQNQKEAVRCIDWYGYYEGFPAGTLVLNFLHRSEANSDRTKGLITVN
jgi:hypothetical protein